MGIQTHMYTHTPDFLINPKWQATQQPQVCPSVKFASVCSRDRYKRWRHLGSLFKETTTPTKAPTGILKNHGISRKTSTDTKTWECDPHLPALERLKLGLKKDVVCLSNTQKNTPSHTHAITIITKRNLVTWSWRLYPLKIWKIMLFFSSPPTLKLNLMALRKKTKQNCSPVCLNQ